MTKKEKDLKYNVTVPKPFHFHRRENLKEKSIRQQKFEKYLEDLSLDTEKHCLTSFKAKPIPREVMVPKYQHLIRAQEQRRQQVKKTSIVLTK